MYFVPHRRHPGTTNRFMLCKALTSVPLGMTRNPRIYFITLLCIVTNLPMRVKIINGDVGDESECQWTVMRGILWDRFCVLVKSNRTE
jgi:hypothetical protein